MSRSLIVPPHRTFMRMAAILILAALPRSSLAQNAAALRAPQAGFGPRLTVEPLAQPVPVFARGRLHLVYELRLASFDSREIRIDHLDVLAGTGSEPPLASYDASALSRILFRAGDTLGIPDPHRIAVGTHLIAYLWIALDSAAEAPPSLSHRFTLATIEGTREDTSTLEAASIAVVREPPVSIGPPLRGGPWFITNGPSNDSRHRRVLIPLEGTLHVRQRFALDLVKHRGADSALPDPTGYGSEVLAVADASVVEVIDGIPDNWRPGQPRPRAARAVPITVATSRGNTVTLDLGAGRYAKYAHLQPGSVRVRTGDRVRRGQVLGLLGNSGNSTGPHLHFNVESAPGIGGNGLPFVFESFDLQAIVPARPDWREHITWFPPGQQARRGEMPLHRWSIQFPQSSDSEIR